MRTRSKLYMSKKNRDKRARELKAQGYAVRRSSMRNQLLHPMYVEDYEQETGRSLRPEDKAFGNTIYKTHFAALYEVVFASTKAELYF